jgi:hypothetical protein
MSRDTHGNVKGQMLRIITEPSRCVQQSHTLFEIMIIIHCVVYPISSILSYPLSSMVFPSLFNAFSSLGVCLVKTSYLSVGNPYSTCS